jgi:hypothetical protein
MRAPPQLTHVLCVYIDFALIYLNPVWARGTTWQMLPPTQHRLQGTNNSYMTVCAGNC